MKKLKKHTLRAERNIVCALCAVIFLGFAGAALAPLPERYTREQWQQRSDAAKDIRVRTLGDAPSVSYPAVSPADLAALQNKKCVLLRRTYAENRAVFDYCGIFAAALPLVADE